MPLISCPRFTPIKEGDNNGSSVYLDFGYLQDVYPIPHIPVKMPKVALAFASLVFTFSSIISRCPLIVMLGLMFRFPGAG